MAFSKRKIVPKGGKITSFKQSSENSFSDSEEEDQPKITPQRKIIPLPKGGAKAPLKKSVKESSASEEDPPIITPQRKIIPLPKGGAKAPLKKSVKESSASEEEEEVKPSKKKPISKAIKKKESSSSEEEEEKVKASKKKPISKAIKKKESSSSEEEEEEEVKIAKKKPIPKVVKKKESSSEEEEEEKVSKKKPIPKVVKKKESSSSEEEEEEEVKIAKKKPISKAIKKKESSSEEEEEVKIAKKKPIPKVIKKKEKSASSSEEEEEEEEEEVSEKKTSPIKPKTNSLDNIPSVLLDKILSFLSIKERAQVARLNSFTKATLYSLPLDISLININYSEIQTLLRNHPTLNLVGLNIDYFKTDNISYLNPILFKILKLSLGSDDNAEKHIDFLWRCNNLKYLRLKDKIEDLAIVGNLTSLTELDITEIDTQTLPPNLFAKLANLHTLSVDVNEYFPIVASIVNLPSLTELTLNGSPDFAPSFMGCPNLKTLYLNFESSDDNGFSFIYFDPDIRLETLEMDMVTPSNLAGADKITTLQRFQIYSDSFDQTGDNFDFLANNPSLTSLEFSGLTELKLELFSGLNKLTQLSLRIHNRDYELGLFHALTDLHLDLYVGFNGVTTLPSTLTKLNIEEDSTTKDLSLIANCVNLVHLDTDANLEDIKDIVNCGKLKTLSLSISVLKDLAPLNSLSDLEELYLTANAWDGKKNSFTWKGINKLAKLRIVSVNLAGSDLSSFKGMKLPSLKELTIHNSSLKTTEGLEGAPSIHELALYGTVLKSFVLNTELLFLKELTIHSGFDGYAEAKEHSNILKDVSGLIKLPVLEKLVIQKSKIKELNMLSNLTSLQELDLFHNKRLTRIGPLKDCINLRKINLSSCSALKSTSFVRGCRSLENLDLENCTSIRQLKGLDECTALRVLNISDVSELMGIKEIFKCTNLETLFMQSLNISSLIGIHRCVNLRYLNIKGCRNIENISPISKLRNIQGLMMGSSNSKYKIQSLAKSKSLQRLDVDGEITDLKEFIKILHHHDNSSLKYLIYKHETIRLDDDDVRGLLLKL